MPFRLKVSKRSHDFLNPNSFRRLDNFLPRRAILRALIEQLPNFSGTLLDVGCGQMPYKPIFLAPPSRVTKYVGLDLKDGQYSHFGPFDLNWDGVSIPLENCTVDCAIATEVFEQCPDPEIVMRETARVLKPRGILFFTVPFLWPIHNPPCDQYRFTPYALERHLVKSGFTDIRLKAFGGWDASLAQMIALWVGRRPMRRLHRVLLSCVALPIVHILAKRDTPPDSVVEFQMVTGISGTAVKNSEC